MLHENEINPEILKKLNLEEKKLLANDIRTFLIESVSKTGGHLASNLGTVELIIALHSVFTTPDDKIIFDVGHQAYTHKILTGRLDKFNLLRSEGGISGFPRPHESEHDAFIGGHSSISISAALGAASAMRLNGNYKNSVIAVVGDGALTGGEIYEGLNNVRKEHGNLIIVLNDNEMSISKNSGAVAAYLSQIRSSKSYYRTKLRVKDVLEKTTLGQNVSRSVSETKRMVKSALIHDNLFENLGVKYYGIVDGHNIEELIEILEFAKMIDEPCIIHVKTTKGKGYTPAEENAGQYHGIDKSGTEKKKQPTASEIFGSELLRLGEIDKNIIVITAAMKYATGCNFFAKKHRNRFFDVGIAEGHAVTFASALASMGKLPVFAVYSTFLQRGIDQLIHDAAIENLHIVLAVDRAGLTGEDGETHQGIFDVPIISSIPNTTIFSPAYSEEIPACMYNALYETKGIAVIRYPRGTLPYSKDENYEINCEYKFIGKSGKRLIITYGRLTGMLRKFIPMGYDVLQLIKIYPLSDNLLQQIFEYESIYFIEESSENGGIAEKLALMLMSRSWRGIYKYRGIKGFVSYADVETQAINCALDFNSLKDFITNDETT